MLYNCTTIDKNFKLMVLTNEKLVVIVLDKDKCNEEEKYDCEFSRELWVGATQD